MQPAEGLRPVPPPRAPPRDGPARGGGPITATVDLYGPAVRMMGFAPKPDLRRLIRAILFASALGFD